MPTDPPFLMGILSLPVGRPTLPLCQTEVNGGDPESWSIAATHAQLVTMQKGRRVLVTVTGSHAVSWARTQIEESGDAAACAKRIELNTGEDGTVNFSFTSLLEQSEAHDCLGLACEVGSLGASGASLINPDIASDALTITDNQVGFAICGATGCSSSDFQEHNNDRVGELTVQYNGASYFEKFCRDSSGLIKYTFTGQVDVTGSAGPAGSMMSATALLFTGTFDSGRWGISFPLAPEFTLSGESVVGSVRGMTISARYITFSDDHAASSSSGTSYNCPTPSYSSDVRTGTTTGTISVAVSDVEL